MEPASNTSPLKPKVAQRPGTSASDKAERTSERALTQPKAHGSPRAAGDDRAAVTENGAPNSTHQAEEEPTRAAKAGKDAVATPDAPPAETSLDAPPPTETTMKKAKKKANGKKGKKKQKKDANLTKTKAKPSAKKDQSPKLGSSRGIETMFRSNYRVHMDLSAIADTKANIMISINGLILPILLGAISPKIDSNPWLLIPTTILMIGCLISMIFAIRSARPRVSNDPVTLDQIKEKGYNILFFGHFSNMTKDDYEEGMTRLMESNEDIYRNMIRDLHGLGSVLNAKYALLRTSYTVFMISITVGVLLFIGTFVLIATGVISAPDDTLAVPYQVIPSP
ncbi:MAG: Pycsar system effector family protein [Bacteroidota bacterium]